MKKFGFQEAVEQIVDEDPRYPAEAYHFVRLALDDAVKRFEKPIEGPGRHVTGGELLEGIRLYALSEFGAITRTVLAHWGIRETIDFGHIVFNLVGKGILGKTDEDKLEDFADGYDFDRAFRTPFRPRRNVNVAAKRLPEEA